MEIVLDELSFSSKVLDYNLNNINYTFKSSITFVSGLNANIIKKLLFQEEKAKSGYIYLSEKGYQYDVCLLTDKYCFKKNNIYEEMLYINKYYKFNYKNIDDKINNTLKMADLDISYLYKDINTFSTVEYKLAVLALALFINPKVLLLDNFAKNMSYNKINYFKKLFNKLNKMYNKNIIIFSNNIDLYLNIIKNILIIDKGNIVFNGTNKDLYNDKLYKYIDMPDIIKCIKYLNKKNHNLDEYIDIKELLKAIYRDVENK